MSKAYILIKNNELRHCYSENVKDKLINDGWLYSGNVVGFNLSFVFVDGKESYAQRRATLKKLLRELDKEEYNDNQTKEVQ